MAAVTSSSVWFVWDSASLNDATLCRTHGKVLLKPSERTNPGFDPEHFTRKRKQNRTHGAKTSGVFSRGQEGASPVPAPDAPSVQLA